MFSKTLTPEVLTTVFKRWCKRKHWLMIHEGLEKLSLSYDALTCPPGKSRLYQSIFQSKEIKKEGIYCIAISDDWLVRYPKLTLAELCEMLAAERVVVNDVLVRRSELTGYSDATLLGARQLPIVVASYDAASITPTTISELERQIEKLQATFTGNLVLYHADEKRKVSLVGVISGRDLTYENAAEQTQPTYPHADSTYEILMRSPISAISAWLDRNDVNAPNSLKRSVQALQKLSLGPLTLNREVATYSHGEILRFFLSELITLNNQDLTLHLNYMLNLFFIQERGQILATLKEMLPEIEISEASSEPSEGSANKIPASLTSTARHELTYQTPHSSTFPRSVPLNGITVISGRSGVGKSTLLNAIYKSLELVEKEQLVAGKAIAPVLLDCVWTHDYKDTQLFDLFNIKDRILDQFAATSAARTLGLDLRSLSLQELASPLFTGILFREKSFAEVFMQRVTEAQQIFLGDAQLVAAFDLLTMFGLETVTLDAKVAELPIEQLRPLTIALAAWPALRPGKRGQKKPYIVWLLDNPSFGLSYAQSRNLYQILAMMTHSLQECTGCFIVIDNSFIAKDFAHERIELES
jgi:ABC-type branched-subunit amino acid transport system ATPase component